MPDSRDTKDEIKSVRMFSKDGGDWIIKCRHCQNIIGVDDGDTDGTPRGEQYKCRCGGWNSVSYSAAYVKEL
ncbi:hypothetical protein [Paraburkholderia kururiensis]|uniref:hypothetical protein n=1 Tax=Paraburkholderia kururiensis TaxID=984307 RepID=UPI0005AABEEA|nr:hypothetical protein [Paraburkholderia kururiensis]